jgi:acetyl-CoA acetyltransferase
VSDGASAIILCQAEIAKKYTDTPIYVLGHGASTDKLGAFEREDLTTLNATVESARQAYEMAKIKPDDVDLAEVHDCFTIAELMAYEDLGFCRKGEGGKLIESGETQVGGRIPVNPSGGLKSKGHPIGATGTGQVYEIVKQLRNQVVKPSRQVSGAEIGLAHNVGGSGGTAVVSILGIGGMK